MPIRAVLFDLDDTLYPEHAFVDAGFRAVAAFLAPELDTDADVLTARLWALHARDGRGRLFDALLAEHGRDDDGDLVLACLLAYRTCSPQLTPFEGVTAGLDELAAAGVRLGIVSDGAAGVQRRKLEGLATIAGRFDVIVLTDELGRGLAKPSPVPFRIGCRLLHVPGREAVYVGNDPRKDFAGARAAGLATVRLGRLPDEGGGREVPVIPDLDADIQVADFPSLTALIAQAVPSPRAFPSTTEVTP